MAEITTNVGALIPINESNGKKAVNARTLHVFLESKQKFTDWIKNRIEKCKQLTDLVFNYSWCINEETVDRFKDDIATIYMLLGEFKKLAEQN